MKERKEMSLARFNRALGQAALIHPLSFVQKTFQVRNTRHIFTFQTCALLI
jgi:hypothetical protein